MKIKICFIVQNFSRGGAEKNMLNTINSLDSNKFEIFLLIIGNENEYCRLLNKNVSIKVLNKKSVLSSVVQIVKYLRIINSSFIYTSVENVSIIITIIKKLRLFNFINIIRIPTNPSNQLHKNYKLYSLLYYKSIIVRKLYMILKSADYIITQTDEMKKELMVIYNFKQNNIYTIRNIVDIETINVLSNEFCSEINVEKFNIIAIGALYEVKGFDYLIKGFADFIIKTQNNDAILHILGDEIYNNRYKDYLTELVINLNLSDRVYFHGHVPNPYKYLKSSDLYVLSSIKEGFPNVVLEALSLNKFVIATDCVSFNNIINDENGLIIKKANSNEITNALIKVYKSKNKTIVNSFKNFNYNKWFSEIYENTSCHK